ncbi:hypothetical protein IGI04_022880 [Brassica rapa subsp. trilocularis]|uniref:1,3-beta-glucan synthase component FKS1-like domain-containing protein n=1 Tax=Brassica rapa subsp. trilocularis TaxID=1813537 RepID=A0ABQ7M294_BRACM|nr:hypothetical protein IGI04_022880 [Brassica rapa subsp. trilocularis]
MAYELHGLLAGNVSIVTGENIKPSYGGDDEAFLLKSKNATGKAAHSDWSNYDDLYEYFWSPDCFYLGWPMRDDGDLSPVSSLQQLFYASSREITITLFLPSILGILDIILNFPGFHRWKFTEILRNILKIAVSLAWCVVLPLCDAQSNSSAPGMLSLFTCSQMYDAGFIIPFFSFWMKIMILFSQQIPLGMLEELLLYYNVGQIGQQVHGGAPARGKSHHIHDPMWWRNWSSTALARRKGTCDDVQLGSWKREGIQSRRMNLCWLRLGQAEHALYDANVCRELKPDWSKRCCFREGVALCFLQRFVEAANAFFTKE